MSEREVMDIAQCSEYLGVAADTLYRYAAEGSIPAFKLGNRWRFKKSVIDAWMARKSDENMPESKEPYFRALSWVNYGQES